MPRGSKAASYIRSRGVAPDSGGQHAVALESVEPLSPGQRNSEGLQNQSGSIEAVIWPTSCNGSTVGALRGTAVTIGGTAVGIKGTSAGGCGMSTGARESLVTAAPITRLLPKAKGIAELFLVRSSEMTELNSKIIKQLVAATAFTSRLLRLSHVEISPDQLVTWVALVHHWPCHAALILNRIEELALTGFCRPTSCLAPVYGCNLDHDSTENSGEILGESLEELIVKIKECLAKAPSCIATLASEDRDPAKLDSFVENEAGQLLSILDLHKLASCSLFVNPFLRYFLKDLEKLYEDSSDPSLEGTQLCPGEKGPAGDWQLGSELYHSILAPRQGETSSKLMFASELALYRAGKIEWRGASSEAVGKTTSGLAADGLLYEAQLEEKQLKTNEAIDMHDPIRSHMQRVAGLQGIVAGTHSDRFPNRQDVSISSMKMASTCPVRLKQTCLECPPKISDLSVQEVCDLIGRISDISAEHASQYQARVLEHNINGLVLSVCQLDQLRRELDMTFGDWQLFSTLVSHLRRTEAISCGDKGIDMLGDSGICLVPGQLSFSTLDQYTSQDKVMHESGNQNSNLPTPGEISRPVASILHTDALGDPALQARYHCQSAGPELKTPGDGWLTSPMMTVNSSSGMSTGVEGDSGRPTDTALLHQITPPSARKAASPTSPQETGMDATPMGAGSPSLEEPESLWRRMARPEPLAEAKTYQQTEESEPTGGEAKQASQPPSLQSAHRSESRRQKSSTDRHVARGSGTGRTGRCYTSLSTTDLRSVTALAAAAYYNQLMASTPHHYKAPPTRLPCLAGFLAPSAYIGQPLGRFSRQQAYPTTPHHRAQTRQQQHQMRHHSVSGNEKRRAGSTKTKLAGSSPHRADHPATPGGRTTRAGRSTASDATLWRSFSQSQEKMLSTRLRPHASARSAILAAAAAAAACHPCHHSLHPAPNFYPLLYAPPQLAPPPPPPPPEGPASPGQHLPFTSWLTTSRSQGLGDLEPVEREQNSLNDGSLTSEDGQVQNSPRNKQGGTVKKAVRRTRKRGKMEEFNRKSSSGSTVLEHRQAMRGKKDENESIRRHANEEDEDAEEVVEEETDELYENEMPVENASNEHSGNETGRSQDEEEDEDDEQEEGEEAEDEDLGLLGEDENEEERSEISEQVDMRDEEDEEQEQDEGEEIVDEESENNDEDDEIDDDEDEEEEEEDIDHMNDEFTPGTETDENNRFPVRQKQMQLQEANIPNSNEVGCFYSALRRSNSPVLNGDASQMAGLAVNMTDLKLSPGRIAKCSFEASVETNQMMPSRSLGRPGSLKSASEISQETHSGLTSLGLPTTGQTEGASLIDATHDDEDTRPRRRKAKRQRLSSSARAKPSLASVSRGIPDSTQKLRSMLSTPGLGSSFEFGSTGSPTSGLSAKEVTPHSIHVQSSSTSISASAQAATGKSANQSVWDPRAMWSRTSHGLTDPRMLVYHASPTHDSAIPPSPSGRRQRPPAAMVTADRHLHSCCPPAWPHLRHQTPGQAYLSPGQEFYDAYCVIPSRARQLAYETLRYRQPYLMALHQTRPHAHATTHHAHLHPHYRHLHPHHQRSGARSTGGWPAIKAQPRSSAAAAASDGCTCDFWYQLELSGCQLIASEPASRSHSQPMTSPENSEPDDAYNRVDAPLDVYSSGGDIVDRGEDQQPHQTLPRQSAGSTSGLAGYRRSEEAKRLANAAARLRRQRPSAPTPKARQASEHVAAETSRAKTGKR